MGRERESERNKVGGGEKDRDRLGQKGKDKDRRMEKETQRDADTEGYRSTGEIQRQRQKHRDPDTNGLSETERNRKIQTVRQRQTVTKIGSLRQRLR